MVNIINLILTNPNKSHCSVSVYHFQTIVSMYIFLRYRKCDIVAKIEFWNLDFHKNVMVKLSNILDQIVVNFFNCARGRRYAPVGCVRRAGRAQCGVCFTQNTINAVKIVLSITRFIKDCGFHFNKLYWLIKVNWIGGKIELKIGANISSMNPLFREYDEDKNCPDCANTFFGDWLGQCFA